MNGASRPLSLGEALRERARSRPSHLALVDGSLRITYAELDERVDRIALALVGADVGVGDRVLWLGQNSYRVFELVMACARLGAMVCPANWRYSAEEMAVVIDDLNPRVVVWQDEEIGEAVRAARSAAGSTALWLQHDGNPDVYSSWVEGAAASGLPPVDGLDPVLAVYTAAWNGRPAAALLSHLALATQGLVLGSIADFGPDAVYLNSGPLYHLGTLMFTFATFMAGGTNVFTRRVDAVELCTTIETERCTGAFLMPPTIDQLVATNADHRYDLSSLRWPGERGPFAEMTSRDVSAWARNPGGYGQTETTGMVTYNALGLGLTGTHGRSAPMVSIRVLDEKGAEVLDGETGEIAVRGCTVMSGYWNRPEENARRQEGGWHRTNDIGRREIDGSLSFIGPKTRMIKSAAENIYPAEVEAAICSHPAVAECAVIGVPDKTWAQSVKAIVKRRDGMSLTEDELIEHCRTRLASYKKPRTVKFVDHVPRIGFSADYDALDAAFGGGGYPGGSYRSA